MSAPGLASGQISKYLLCGPAVTGKAEMYDIVGRQKGSVAPDLPEYIMERDYVSAALRTARDLDAGEAEWAKFVEDLKNGR